ncbi:hypothetical protein F5882DRAFT_514378 [Hyaloscypha sp. PMI_1271]|nr:hypothetical protein F5882DRAFT_514378 [Hyaloscypha sp. PMI_1271]
MGQVAKRLDFGHDSSSDAAALQRKVPSKMMQTSILRYITSDRQHLSALNSSSFLLRLPYDIRKKIYEFAGLYNGELIRLNYRPSPWMIGNPRTDYGLKLVPPSDDWEFEDEVSEYCQRVSRFLDGPNMDSNWKPQRTELYCCDEYEFNGNCDCDFDPSSLPSQLLDVCRTISKEVEHLFYSQNHFSIYSIQPGGLFGLLSFTPRALNSLSSLSINLDICHCVVTSTTSKPSYCPYHYRGCYRLCIPGSEKLCQSAAVYHRSQTIAEWEKLCRHLASYITPRQLKLWVFCNVVNIETAKQIVGSMNHLPVLAACGISFDLEPCLKLDDLVRDAVLKLTGRSSDALDAPFRFLDLPREIQLNILKYTDLTTPYDVAWCPDARVEARTVVHGRSIQWSEGINVYWWKCCGKCSPFGMRCICLTRFIGYSTTCTCWTMPSSLFWVSRRQREDAIKIFYSQNHFLILPSQSGQRSEILPFFTRFAARGMKYLRFVTWLLPDIFHPISGTRRAWEWELAVDICAQEGNLQLLSFAIDLSNHARRRRASGAHYHGLIRNSFISIAQLEEYEWNTGLFLVESIARYKSWKDVYVHLSWPWHIPTIPMIRTAALRRLRTCYDRRHAWNGYICNYEDPCEQCEDEG